MTLRDGIQGREYRNRESPLSVFTAQCIFIGNFTSGKCNYSKDQCSPAEQQSIHTFQKVLLRCLPQTQHRFQVTLFTFNLLQCFLGDVSFWPGVLGYLQLLLCVLHVQFTLNFTMLDTLKPFTQDGDLCVASNILYEQTYFPASSCDINSEDNFFLMFQQKTPHSSILCVVSKSQHWLCLNKEHVDRHSGHFKDCFGKATASVLSMI